MSSVRVIVYRLVVRLLRFVAFVVHSARHMMAPLLSRIVLTGLAVFIVGLLCDLRRSVFLRLNVSIYNG